MLATTLVYHINELNDVETNVDKLVIGRRTFICNKHLFNKSKKSKIYNYVIRYPTEITNYVFPLEKVTQELIVLDDEPKAIGVARPLRKTYLWSKKIKLAVYKLITYLPKIISGNYTKKAKNND